MSIYIDNENKVFYLETKNMSYVMDVKEGYLRHVYYGTKIGRTNISMFVKNHRAGYLPDITGASDGRGCLDTMPQEYSSFGYGDFRNSCVRIVEKNGARVTDLKYSEYKIHGEKPELEAMPALKGGETLEVILKDEVSKVNVHLFYTLIEEEDTILRHAEIENASEEAISLEQAMSFCLDLPDMKYDVLSLVGRHANERQVDRHPITRSVEEISSNRGISSHQHNPFMALLRKNADEYSGEVLGFNLVYSGNFKFTVETDSFGQTRVVGGINDLDFGWKLESKSRFVTPEMVMVYSASGINEMSQKYHNVYRNHLIRNFTFEKRPIVINSWEAMYFDFNETKLIQMIDKAKGTGIDTFVLDDGWFGHRDDDKTSLGDWFVNENKLKGGLKPIIDRCKANGLKFGIWIEPEMISEDSELYKKHSDWAVKCPNRQPMRSRHQLVLDMSRKEVVEYLKEVLTDLLDNNEVHYVKWDMNRNITENFSNALPAERAKEFSHRFVLGLYELSEYLTTRYPHILFEACAGGGGRFDPAMLYYFPQIWASDNTDAEERTRIQYGTSYCYPLSSMSCHVSVCPNHETNRMISMYTRGNIASFGAFGYELDLSKMNEEEYAMIKEQTELYRRNEDLILSGDMYRLINPFEGNNFGMAVLNKEKTRGMACFFQKLASQGLTVNRFKIMGLDPEKTYKISGLDYELVAEGSIFMNMGIQINKIKFDFSSIMFEIIAVD